MLAFSTHYRTVTVIVSTIHMRIALSLYDKAAVRFQLGQEDDTTSGTVFITSRCPP